MHVRDVGLQLLGSLSEPFLCKAVTIAQLQELRMQHVVKTACKRSMTALTKQQVGQLRHKLPFYFQKFSFVVEQWSKLW